MVVYDRGVVKEWKGGHGCKNITKVEFLELVKVGIGGWE